ncbi:hypothetical protein FOZ60_000289 [Perkinsus olseni]|uniref:Uncharacterized protein n=2 Tax=Perkinsus olseni TaxID=32597 RepID=A0A7J6N2A0_PEROL|nr:hypothetical protein FOZ60_000289 [Perkinsus olseni]
MATTHILIAALASAVFISNLPVSNALGALAPQVEDFPPLIEWELEPLGYDDGIVGSPPPRNSGLDPLRGLDNSTFTPMLRELGDHTEGVLSRYQAQIKPAYKLLKRICLSLREAMMRKFGSFGSMCDEYYRMSKNAIKTAEDEGWQHEEKNSQGIDYIHPPGLRLYMD